MRGYGISDGVLRWDAVEAVLEVLHRCSGSQAQRSYATGVDMYDVLWPAFETSYPYFTI